MSDTTAPVREKSEVPVLLRVFLGILASGASSWLLTWCSMHGVDFQTLGVSSELIKATITSSLTGVFVAPECIPLMIAGLIMALRKAKRTIKNAFDNPLPPEMQGIVLAGALALSLTACSLFGTLESQHPALPQNVDAIKAAITTVEMAAVPYQTRHLCGHTTDKLCSDINVVRKIEKARLAAMVAIRAAEASENETTIGAAQQAYVAFEQIVLLITPQAPAAISPVQE